MGLDQSIVDYSRIQIDRTRELESWASVLWPYAEQGREAFVYVNNHFAGHSPASARELQRLLRQTVGRAGAARRTDESFLTRYVTWRSRSSHVETFAPRAAPAARDGVVALARVHRGVRRRVRDGRRVLGHLVAHVDRPRLVLDAGAPADSGGRTDRRAQLGLRRAAHDLPRNRRRAERRGRASGDSARRSARGRASGAAARC